MDNMGLKDNNPFGRPIAQRRIIYALMRVKHYIKNPIVTSTQARELDHQFEELFNIVNQLYYDVENLKKWQKNSKKD